MAQRMTGPVQGAMPVTGGLMPGQGGIQVQGPGQGVSMGALLPAIAQGVRQPNIQQPSGAVPNMGALGAGIADAGQSIGRAVEQAGNRQFEAQSQVFQANRQREDMIIRETLSHQSAISQQADAARRAYAMGMAQKAWDLGSRAETPEMAEGAYKAAVEFGQQAFTDMPSLAADFAPVLQSNLVRAGMDPGRAAQTVEQARTVAMGKAIEHKDPGLVQDGIHQEGTATALIAMLTKEAAVKKGRTSTLNRLEQARMAIGADLDNQVKSVNILRDGPIKNVGQQVFFGAVKAATTGASEMGPQQLMEAARKANAGAPVSAILEGGQAVQAQYNAVLADPSIPETQKQVVLQRIASDPRLLQYQVTLTYIQEEMQNAASVIRSGKKAESLDVYGAGVRTAFDSLVQGEIDPALSARSGVLTKAKQAVGETFGMDFADPSNLVKSPSVQKSLTSAEGWLASEIFNTARIMNSGGYQASLAGALGVSLQRTVDEKTGKVGNFAVDTEKELPNSFAGAYYEANGAPDSGEDHNAIVAKALQTWRTRSPGARALSAYRRAGEPAFPAPPVAVPAATPTRPTTPPPGYNLQQFGDMVRPPENTVDEQYEIGGVQ